MNGERVFLTGGSGRIGRRVERKLLERGYAVRSLVHRDRPQGPAHPDLELVQGDILDQEGLTRLVPGCSFVVHLAAAWDMFPPAVYEKENNQLFESVVRGTYNMLEASYAAKGLRCFLYASTDAAYATGPRKFDAPITEDTELQPSRFYALAKIVCEEMCRQYGKLSSLPWLIVRICWCLDMNEILRIFQYDFWEAGLSTEDRARLAPLLAGGRGVFAPLMPDGSSGVDHVSDPEDIAEGIVLGVVNHAAGLRGVYNLAGPSNFRYRELIEKLAVDLGVPWGSAPVKGIEPYELSTERARRVLGYNPRYPIERMLTNAVRYGKEHTR
ncbi:MAG: NAD(P)-dependent oxidoreductase [Acidobacteria bacterium]|nr:NAD(P)-dependent oxidoreductase [Acidobacteriota bacterium]